MHLSFTITLAALLAAASSMAFPSYNEHHSRPSYPYHDSSYPQGHTLSYPEHHQGVTRPDHGLPYLALPSSSVADAPDA
ncbi:MAG: hypothetical protein DHS80DRAFT_32709 [Piptocephalis tieghemiana]|nr:MAG: hypothetical protein DHS80DRAFT_32709 [Piptocephalis tieghemiana]